MNQDKPKGFFKSLFDFSFTHFITPRIVKLLYALAIAWAGLIGLYVFVVFVILTTEVFVSNEFGAGTWVLGVVLVILGLIAAIIAFFLTLLWGRVRLECIAVLFRVKEQVAEIASKEDVNDNLS